MVGAGPAGSIAAYHLAAAGASYERRVKGRLARNLAYAWAGRGALERFPRLMFRFACLEPVQAALERLARDDPAPVVARRLSAPLLVGLRLASR